MVGGYDFMQSQFNRAVQSLRQPGSAFKPLIYAAAMEEGMTPASTVLDAPLTGDIAGAKGWRPENYDGKYHGPTTLRSALTHSRNLVTVRLLDKIGVHTICAPRAAAARIRSTACARFRAGSASSRSCGSPSVTVRGVA